MILMYMSFENSQWQAVRGRTVYETRTHVWRVVFHTAIINQWTT